MYQVRVSPPRDAQCCVGRTVAHLDNITSVQLNIANLSSGGSYFIHVQYCTSLHGIADARN